MASSSKPLVIIGAGADYTKGIELPMVKQLLPEIARFLESEGAEFEKTLRSHLPNMRFTFQRHIKTQIDDLTKKEPTELRAYVVRVKEAADKIQDPKDPAKKQGKLVELLFNKLMSIQSDSVLGDEIEGLIKEVFDEPTAKEILVSDSVVDFHKVTLSDTFKSVLRYILGSSLEEDANAVAEALGADMLNIEQLLIDKFLGFYNEKPGDVKSYIYISWCFWAFMVHRQRQILAAHDGVELPFYSGIPENARAITLNYTNFLEERLGARDSLYFHGDLSKYVSMDTRDLISIDNFPNRGLLDILKKEVLENIKLEGESLTEQRHVIPALVPPLRLKPVLSFKYIELWYQAAQWIQSAKHIAIIGYSFNTSDEHFNDILRANHGKRVDVISPNATGDHMQSRMEKVFSIPIGNWKTMQVQGHDARQANGIRLIAARADQIDLEKLFEE
ncbi:MAG: hypothetical protein JNM31_14820 [Flavobacteriales bacterium]|nr:hypothetical protein [Flavobacteriales bacterium]